MTATTFQVVTSKLLAEQIRSADKQVIFMAPSATKEVACALVDAGHNGNIGVRAIIDADEDVCHIGYGDVAGMQKLQKAAMDHAITLKKQPGVRLGLLVTDDIVTIWSPTPLAVDGERQSCQPNGVVLGGGHSDDSTARSTGEINGHQGDEGTGELSPENLAAELEKRMEEEEVGKQPIEPGEMEEIVKNLTDNPPEPFNLARKVRVFSSKFRFVETEVQGANWTNRRVSLSSLLLNPDVPDDLQDVLQVQIRPYGPDSRVAIKVPCIVRGEIAYNKNGIQILRPMTQRDLDSEWNELRNRYLVKIPSFGWLIRRQEVRAFKKEVKAFQEVLRCWVEEFRYHVYRGRDKLVDEIVAAIRKRLELANEETKAKWAERNLRLEVKNGLGKIRYIKPRTRVFIKDVSWESSRDPEFTTALQKALPAKDLAGWFDEFTAAKEKRDSDPENAEV